MHTVHEKFGSRWSGSRKGTHTPRKANAVTDSGCQTCSAGTDFLKDIGCPEAYLVPTSHRIVGITTSSLDIIGAVFLRIEVEGRITRQMVHISRNTHGLYLSETALPDLGLVHADFPHPIPKNQSRACAQTTTCCEENEGACPAREPPPERPDRLPFKPTVDNLPKFEKYFLAEFGKSAFNMCVRQPLPGMYGEDMQIVFKQDGVKPRRSYTPIPIPHHWKEPVKKLLDGYVSNGTMEKVEQGEVTDEWCSQMIVVPKSDGSPRITVDYQQLNQCTVREIHHTPSPINLVSTIPAGKVKTVLDAWNGFHSMELAQESRPATRFITEFGCYQYCRGHQGWHGTGDAYTKRFDDITSNEKRYIRITDDGLLWDDDIEKAFWHTFDHLKVCAEHGIVFNRDKFKFARDVVDFAGFEVNMEGYKPADRTLSAIKDFPSPKNITDIRSWFGLVNQVAYTFAQHKVMEPFRELLKKGRQFYWDTELELLFQKSKEEIVRQSNEGVHTFDTNKPTLLTTDWCKTGIGFALTQKHCTYHGPIDPNCGPGHWKLVRAGSRFTTKEEQNLLSPTEGECLAAIHGLQACRMFTLGCPNLTLAVDHRPLINILNDRSLSSIDNPRLLKLKEKSLRFKFNVMYVRGASEAIRVADALSRHPTEQPTGDDTMGFEPATAAFAASQADGVEAITWNKVVESAATDEECATLAQTIINGFPNDKSQLPEAIHPYWGMRNELYVIDGVPFKGKKMLIPKALRPFVLDGLHAANQGVTGMMSNARDRFFWPGLDAAVRLLRQQCRQCNEQAPSQHSEPPIHPPTPLTPFEQTVTDLCDLEGHKFLIYADRFSGWVEVERLSHSTFRHVNEVFLRWFRTYGVPEEMSSDGGPPFNSIVYNTFLKTWDIRKRLSSAHYPQSNGRAEAAVKSMKRILLGNINPVTGELNTDAAARAIMLHRNTPAQDTGIAPSVMLFGKLLRDHLPLLNHRLRPEWDEIARSREDALARHVLISQPPSKQGELAPLNVGDSVQVQNQTGHHPTKWNHTGVIAVVHPNRQYQVIMDGS